MPELAQQNKPGKNTAGFPADRLEKIQASFPTLRKSLTEKKAVNRNGQPERIYDFWLYQQSNVIVELTEI